MIVSGIILVVLLLFFCCSSGGSAASGWSILAKLVLLLLVWLVVWSFFCFWLVVWSGCSALALLPVWPVWFWAVVVVLVCCFGQLVVVLVWLFCFGGCGGYGQLGCSAASGCGRLR